MGSSRGVALHGEHNGRSLSPYLKKAIHLTTVAATQGRTGTKYCQGAGGSKKHIQVEECESTHKLIAELD